MRLVTFALLSFLPVAGYAFDPEPRPDRIALLEPQTHHDRTALRSTFMRQLSSALRQQGFTVIDTALTYDDVLEHGVDGADYIIDVAGESGHSSDYGEIGFGGRDGGLALSIVGSRVVARLLVYDADTMELLADRILTQRASTVVPLIGFGTRIIHAFVGVPFFERGHQRSLTRAIGQEAAAVTASTIREHRSTGEPVP